MEKTSPWGNLLEEVSSWKQEVHLGMHRSHQTAEPQTTQLLLGTISAQDRHETSYIYEDVL